MEDTEWGLRASPAPLSPLKPHPIFPEGTFLRLKD